MLLHSIYTVYAVGMSNELDTLRSYAAEAARAAHFCELRDSEILRMRNSVNPGTGRAWTWKQLAVAADMSPMGALKASGRAESKR